MQDSSLSRRSLLGGGLALAGIGKLQAAPTSTVAIARCRTFDRQQIDQSLRAMFDQMGGIASLVKNKPAPIKLTLTGQPQRFPIAPALPYRTNPAPVLPAAPLTARGGARRIRILETFFPAGQ